MRTGERVAFLVIIVLQLGAFGCYCHRLDFVAFEGQPDVRIVDRTFRVREGSTRTIWPIPARYEVVREKYTIELLTVVPGHLHPALMVRARAADGRHLQLFADGRLRKQQWAPEIGRGSGQGSIAFDVLSEGERIGSEAFQYEIQSRPLACEWDLP